jgi:formylglycine-generating enzyme required for sulfatase activity
LFYDSVAVVLRADEPCSLFYKTSQMPGWAAVSEPVVFRRSDILQFYGLDTAGNPSGTKTEDYRLQQGGRPPCPRGMVHVPGTGQGFCIDQYEWPNVKGKTPLAMISLYAARDSCLSAGKRLCAAQEWYLACAGPLASAYAYGPRYEPRACNTHDTTVQASGMLAECRSYFGAMDMNGNVREWTNTRSADNQRFYQVYGGFWESHSRSDCGQSQYSFYPQNTHFSVGFRCCADLSSDSRN